MKQFCLAAAAALVLTLGLAACEGPTGPAGPSGTSAILAHATVDADAGSVFAFGGAKIDSVVVTGGVGDKVVEFFGDWTGVENPTVLVTMFDTDDFNVASLSADQNLLTPTSFRLRVFIWSTRESPNLLQDADFSILIVD